MLDATLFQFNKRIWHHNSQDAKLKETLHRGFDSPTAVYVFDGLVYNNKWITKIQNHNQPMFAAMLKT